MGRLSTVDDQIVFAAVGKLLSSHGNVGLQDVVKETGVSIGSLYHRYGSKEGLLAQVWLDAVQAFQARIFAALEGGKPEAGEEAAAATPRFCREEPARARVLICCRREELLGPDTPAELREKIDGNTVLAAKAVADFAKKNGYSLEACRAGIVAFPLGAVRLYLPDNDVPDSIDDYVIAAYRSAISVDAASPS